MSKEIDYSIIRITEVPVLKPLLKESQRMEWWERIKTFENKTCKEFVEGNQGILNGQGNPEPPMGWLRFFAQLGCIALEPRSPSMVDSRSDERTVNNVMRHAYRVLDEDERAQMQAVKDQGLELYQLIESIGSSRELSLALTRVEEAVMWATKHITK